MAMLRNQPEVRPHMKTAIIVPGNPPNKNGTVPYNLQTRLDKAKQD